MPLKITLDLNGLEVTELGFERQRLLRSQLRVNRHSMEQLGTCSLRLTYSAVPSAREGSSLAKGQPESSVETPSGTADSDDSQTARKAGIP
jgi:hypothetical protein